MYFHSSGYEQDNEQFITHDHKQFRSIFTHYKIIANPQRRMYWQKWYIYMESVFRKMALSWSEFSYMDTKVTARALYVTKINGSLTIGVQYDKDKNYTHYNAHRTCGRIKYSYLCSNWRQHYRSSEIQRVHVFTQPILGFCASVQNMGIWWSVFCFVMTHAVFSQ